MGDGVSKSDSSPSKPNQRDKVHPVTGGPASEGRDQPPQGLIGNTDHDQAAHRCREEGLSAEAAVAARSQERSSLSKFIGDRIIPLLTVAFQAPPLANHGDAVYDPQKQAELLYSGVQDPAKKAELIDNQKIADNAIMHHTDYLPLLRDTQARRDLMAYALGDGDVTNNGVDCAHCADIRNLVSNDYWNEVLLAGSNGNIGVGGKLLNDGRLLDPHSADPNERQLWENQAKILAKLSSLLVKDDGPLLHAEEFNRYHKDPRFRLRDEPLPPPADFNHHLPEQFSTSIFVDNQGKPRVFNVREIQERETFSILHGELKSDLDAEERAVLALHTEVLDQVRPWELLADGNMIQDANMKAQMDAYRDNILANYKADFQKFDIQIAAVLEKNGPLCQQKWNQYKIDAVGKIPSTAQALHFLTQAESAAFTPEQIKARGWDTRNQTDAELIRETIRRAQWQHLIAVQSFVNDGVLFPQAIGTQQDAHLPSAMLVQARALISGTNVNDFGDLSVVEDPARRFAMRQQIWEQNKGRNMQDIGGIPGANEINKWVSDNLTRWKDHGYPWPLAYVYNRNTNFQPARSQRDALTQFTPWKCDQNNRNRGFLVDNANKPPATVNQPGMVEQNKRDNMALDAARRAAQKANRGRMLQGQGGRPGQPPPPPQPARPALPQLTNCACTNEWELPNANPFKTYRKDKDPMLRAYESIVP